MAKIHPTALVDPGAELDGSVEVGAYALIGAGVTIGARTTVGAHCVIEGNTRIGEDNRIWQFASIGAAPQDKKYAGEPTGLEIGNRNTVREFCTLNRGTAQDVGVTRLGDDNWIMAYVHVAHDCQLGNQIVLANNTQLAGHVHIGDWAVLGGFTGVHQFVRVGAHVMTGIASVLTKDLPPYIMCGGNPTAPHGINSEGLKRRGFTTEQIDNLRRAYKVLYRSGHTLEVARAELEKAAANQPELKLLLDFFAASTRGILR
jgi:UDP-N-acetylglucosamine acyltransferase